MTISQFAFNSYAVNTYLLAAADNKAVIIDPACADKKEFAQLEKTIAEKQLDVVCILLTHPHADHVLGVKFVKDAFPNAQFLLHKEGLPLYEAANDYSLIMGFQKRELPAPTGFLSDGPALAFSDIKLNVFYTPGHAPGSVCYYAEVEGVVFTGDVLFHSSIGRTDLPGGNYKTLLTAIREKLFTLPNSTIVLPGHGEETSIEFEKQHNPFL
jgi:glyoxylase-like metal-dependent hydrolase (beta-lactamase superfamily II)